ncbi:hypothetical protein EVAR_100947_1 [Eumeta japonica]|uniref:Uncharacterized protein n=1 Tax=Eumeta variegata TaxID=151549 RepID=A0A4C1SB39_EUMVA|nr:hypothetical protein EVAR_100947_1 [Eumeta japonica]
MYLYEARNSADSVRARRIIRIACDRRFSFNPFARPSKSFVGFVVLFLPHPSSSRRSMAQESFPGSAAECLLDPRRVSFGPISRAFTILIRNLHGPFSRTVRNNEENWNRSKGDRRRSNASVFRALMGRSDDIE